MQVGPIHLKSRDWAKTQKVGLLAVVAPLQTYRKPFQQFANIPLTRAKPNGITIFLVIRELWPWLEIKLKPSPNTRNLI